MVGAAIGYGLYRWNRSSGEDKVKKAILIKELEEKIRQIDAKANQADTKEKKRLTTEAIRTAKDLGKLTAKDSRILLNMLKKDEATPESIISILKSCN